jgi:hypothetical protein
MRFARYSDAPELQLQFAVNPSPMPQKSPDVFVPFRTKPTVVYETYWRFASERQEIFFRRVNRKSPPWTKDHVLQKHKFTNVYRASDRVSQYLIREVIYKGDASAKETFFRIILFKLFNRIETWELLKRELGDISYRDFREEKYDATLTKALEAGERLYSAAYIMPSGGSPIRYSRKHRMHLWLLGKMMKDNLPNKISNSKSMSEAFDLIREYPSIGDFLAYQYITDLNYSELTDFSEMSFVKPGPGCLSGIKKCFSDLGALSEADIIKMMAERQNDEFARLGLRFQNLWGRPLQLIDCQNIFCEVDKYSRIVHPEICPTGRTRIKQLFRPESESIRYWFPPKWGLNKFISESHV